MSIIVVKNEAKEMHNNKNGKTIVVATCEVEMLIEERQYNISLHQQMDAVARALAAKMNLQGQWQAIQISPTERIYALCSNEVAFTITETTWRASLRELLQR